MVWTPSSGLKNTNSARPVVTSGEIRPANDCQSLVRKPSHLLSLIISPLDVITVKQIIQLLIFAHPSEVDTGTALASRLWLSREYLLTTTKG